MALKASFPPPWNVHGSSFLVTNSLSACGMCVCFKQLPHISLAGKPMNWVIAVNYILFSNLPLLFSHPSFDPSPPKKNSLGISVLSLDLHFVELAHQQDTGGHDSNLCCGMNLTEVLFAKIWRELPYSQISYIE